MNVIGFAWWLAEPLTLTLVYVFIVQIAFKSAVPDYALFVISALLPFKWLSSALIGSIGTVRLNGQLVTDVYFPRALLPLVENVVGLAHFAVGLAVIPVFMFAYGRPPTIHMLWLPLVLGTQFLLILAFAYPMSVWGLHFRNVQNLSGNILRLWFYASPGIWSLSQLDNESIIRIVKLNPLTGLFLSYHAVFYDGKAPGWELAYTAGFSLLVLVWGFRYYIRREAQFGKLV
jgi:ABC-type polysaccharide/polyol phosphate export permease